MSSTLWKFVLFGTIGVTGEVFFTALIDLFKTRRLRLYGFSFIWMFPIYGLLAFFFEPVHARIVHQSWILRGLIYMVGIYGVEFLTGTILTSLTGAPIWQYTDRLNFRGQITGLYAPVWFTVGLLVEKYEPWIARISRVLTEMR